MVLYKYDRVVLANDRDSVAVSSIGFGAAIYSSNNCLASSCKSHTTFSAASSPVYKTSGCEKSGQTLLTILYAKLQWRCALGKREMKTLYQFLHLA